MPEKEEPLAQFDPETVSNDLRTVGQPTTDLAFGAGQRYDLATGHLSLEVFPTSRLSRITTPTSRIELFATSPPQVIDGQVVFGRESEQEDITLTVSPEGTVVFGYVSCPPPPKSLATAPERSPQPSHTAPAASGTAPAGREQPTADLTPPAARTPATTSTSADTPSPTRGSHAADTPPKEQAPRVQLTGRLGRDPTFRTTTKTGTLVGRFPLAEHHEDGTTRWHTVLALGDRAQQLQRRIQAGELAQGRQVDVVGYLHTTTRASRDGRPRTVQEVYATAVTRH